MRERERERGRGRERERERGREREREGGRERERERERGRESLKTIHGWNFRATAGFEDSDSFQKVIKVVLRCIFSVISRLSGFKH